jgi:hypothetical protein
MTCAAIIPAHKVALCDFVDSYGLKLTVQEDGKGTWHASLSPTVQTYDEGTWASEPSWVEVSGRGGQAHLAIASLCRSLSGARVRVLIAKERRRFFGARYNVVSIEFTRTVVTPES